MHIADRSVADTNPDGRRLHLADDVRHPDVLADLRRILEPTGITADGHRIITGYHIAIANAYVPADVDIECVGVDVVESVAHRHSADNDILAAVEQTAPAAHVLERDVAHLDIRALDENDFLPGPALFTPLTFGVAGSVSPSLLVPIHNLLIEERASVSVYDTLARYLDVLLFEHKNEVFGAPSLADASVVLRIRIVGVVVVEIGTAEQNRAILKMQLGIAADINRTRKISAARQNDTPALSGAGVQRLLNGGGILRNTIPLRSKRSNVVYFGGVQRRNAAHAHQKESESLHHLGTLFTFGVHAPQASSRMQFRGYRLPLSALQATSPTLQWFRKRDAVPTYRNRAPRFCVSNLHP